MTRWAEWRDKSSQWAKKEEEEQKNTQEEKESAQKEWNIQDGTEEEEQSTQTRLTLENEQETNQKKLDKIKHQHTITKTVAETKCDTGYHAGQAGRKKHQWQNTYLEFQNTTKHFKLVTCFVYILFIYIIFIHIILYM